MMVGLFDFEQNPEAIGRVYKISGPFSWDAIASVCRASKRHIDCLRSRRKTLTIRHVDRLKGFAGLHLFRKLRKIVVGELRDENRGVGVWTYEAKQPYFNSSLLWRLVDANSDTLTTMRLHTTLLGLPCHPEVEGPQAFEVYGHHLYRCGQLRSLEVELPPAAVFAVGPGSFWKTVFVRLRHLTLNYPLYFDMDDTNNSELGRCLAEGSVHMMNLIELKLSWPPPSRNLEGVEAVGAQRHPHVFQEFWERAHLPKLSSLTLIGPVWGPHIMHAQTQFINRHATRLVRLKALPQCIDALDETFGTLGIEMLQLMSPMTCLKEIMLPMPPNDRLLAHLRGVQHKHAHVTCIVLCILASVVSHLDSIAEGGWQQHVAPNNHISKLFQCAGKVSTVIITFAGFKEHKFYHLLFDNIKVSEPWEVEAWRFGLHTPSVKDNIRMSLLWSRQMPEIDDEANSDDFGPVALPDRVVSW